jgi:hypothetical protein
MLGGDEWVTAQHFSQRTQPVLSADCPGKVDTQPRRTQQLLLVLGAFRELTGPDGTLDADVGDGWRVTSDSSLLPVYPLQFTAFGGRFTQPVCI